MLEIVGLLVRTYIMPSGSTMADEHISEVVDKILQLMLCIVSGLHSYNDMSNISGCSLQWAPVFDLQKSRYWLQGSGLLELLFYFHFSGSFYLFIFIDRIEAFCLQLVGFYSTTATTGYFYTK